VQFPQTKIEGGGVRGGGPPPAWSSANGPATVQPLVKRNHEKNVINSMQQDNYSSGDWPLETHYVQFCREIEGLILALTKADVEQD
jgi:hypothetical protein